MTHLGLSDGQLCKKLHSDARHTAARICTDVASRCTFETLPQQFAMIPAIATGGQRVLVQTRPARGACSGDGQECRGSSRAEAAA